MKRYILLLFVLHNMILFADTLTVKKDSTGNYTEIQAAVDAAAANGDVVLVYPGIYYENVDFHGKSINLFSTYALHPDDSLIRLTIIDGHQSGACVEVDNVANGAIKGFTLKNGIGHLFNSANSPVYGGGGVFFRNSTAGLSHCIIKNNSATYGGGVSIINSNVMFSGNSIHNNQAFYYGGGVVIANDNSTVVFDQNDLNSIYLNYSSIGYDLVRGDLSTVNNIKLDTATVKSPDHYYFSSFTSFMYQNGNISYENAHWIMEQVDTDLYVSPYGDNNNSGLSPENPLKTVAFALLKIKSDSLHPNKIHIASGTYSDSLTGEKLALGLKSYVTLEGSGIDSTIIDGEKKTHFATLGPGEQGTSLKNLRFINGDAKLNDGLIAGLRADRVHKMILDSIGIMHCRGMIWTAAFLGANDTLIIKNSRFIDNYGDQPIIIYTLRTLKDIYFSITNCEVAYTYNTYPFDFDTTIKIAIPLAIMGLNPLENGNGRVHGDIIGCLFHDNTDSAGNSNLPSITGVGLQSHTTVNFVNNTFADNHSENLYGSPLEVGGASKAFIYNCIFYNNVPYNVHLVNNQYYDADSLYVYYSCFENGVNSIDDLGQYNYLYYDSSNIDNDPQFLGSDEYVYNLHDGSPCIDAGTLNLPGGINLPETDIAGNPRIFNDKIDMGAYEWNPMVGFRSNKFPKQKKHIINVSPNPFKDKCKITFEIGRYGFLRLNIFNQQGLLVKHLEKNNMNLIYSEIYWDGTDDNGNALPPGVYIISLTINDKELASCKIIKQ